jgi:DNA-binding NtrC family response regulator
MPWRCWRARPWRGNIRELRNVLEQAAMRSDSQSIDAEQIEAVLRETGCEPAAPCGPVPCQSPGRWATPCYLLRPWPSRWPNWSSAPSRPRWKPMGGNKLAVARQLGISRATLYGRLENPEAGA